MTSHSSDIVQAAVLVVTALAAVALPAVVVLSRTETDREALTDPHSHHPRMMHDPKTCHLCSTLRHPSQVTVAQAVRGALPAQARSNGENRSMK